jgi:hypothetical protein
VLAAQERVGIGIMRMEDGRRWVKTAVMKVKGLKWRAKSVIKYQVRLIVRKKRNKWQ